MSVQLKWCSHTVLSVALHPSSADRSGENPSHIPQEKTHWSITNTGVIVLFPLSHFTYNSVSSVQIQQHSEFILLSWEALKRTKSGAESKKGWKFSSFFYSSFSSNKKKKHWIWMCKKVEMMWLYLFIYLGNGLDKGFFLNYCLERFMVCV